MEKGGRRYKNTWNWIQMHDNNLFSSKTKVKEIKKRHFFPLVSVNGNFYSVNELLPIRYGEKELTKQSFVREKWLQPRNLVSFWFSISVKMVSSSRSLPLLSHQVVKSFTSQTEDLLDDDDDLPNLMILSFSLMFLWLTLIASRSQER